MQINPVDILIKNDASGRTLWVSQELVRRICDISEAHLKKNRSIYKMTVSQSYQHHKFLPDTGKGWRWGHQNSRFFYDLKRIPNKAPQFYRYRFPSEDQILVDLSDAEIGIERDHQLVAADSIKQLVKAYVNKSDEKWYRYESPITYPLNIAQDLSEALAWLRMMQQYYLDDRTIELGLKNKGTFLSVCAEILNRKKLKGMHITSPVYLRRKITALPGDPIQQRQYLLHGNIENQNATKVGRTKLVDQDTGEVLSMDLHEAIIYYLYMNPGSPIKLSKTQMYRLYVESCNDFQVEPVAERTFCHRVSRWPSRIRADQSRHGQDYYQKHVLTYVPGDKLRYAHSLFAADGSATIAYKWYDKGGKCRKMNLYVLMVTDVASKYIAGWAPSPEGFHVELPEMVIPAVKMAVINGGNQTMFEIVTDNHGAFTGAKSKIFLESVFNRVRTIVPGNSQANDAETHFRLLKKSLKQFYNFMRSSFTGGLEGQANPDSVVKNEDLPSYQEVITQFTEIVDTWNNTMMPNGCTPADLFAIKHPDCEPLDDRLCRHLFGHNTRVDVSNGRGFVNVTRVILGKKNTTRFEIPDYETTGIERISRMTGHGSQLPVFVYFDDNYADLYTLAGEYILTCRSAALAGKSEAEKTDDHRLAESHHVARKAKALKIAVEFERTVVNTHNLLAIGSAVDPSMLDPYTIRMTDTSLKHRKEEINAEYEGALNGVVGRIINDFDEDEIKSAPRVPLKDPWQDAFDQI